MLKTFIGACSSLFLSILVGAASAKGGEPRLAESRAALEELRQGPSFQKAFSVREVQGDLWVAHRIAAGHGLAEIGHDLANFAAFSGSAMDGALAHQVGLRVARAQGLRDGDVGVQGEVRDGSGNLLFNVGAALELIGSSVGFHTPGRALYRVRVVGIRDDRYVAALDSDNGRPVIRFYDLKLDGWRFRRVIAQGK
jgi:hypothetical protein